MKPKKKYGKALWKQIEDAVRDDLTSQIADKASKAQDKQIWHGRKRIKSVSSKRAKELAMYRKIKAKLFKDKPDCQACPRFGYMPIPATDIHHFAGKQGKLLCHERFFILVCRGCHRAIHDHPAIARELGLLAPIGQFNNQGLVV